MAPKNDGAAKRIFNKGAWTAEEDRILAQYIEIHGAKKWRAIATKSGNIWDGVGLNRCGQSCRLRWLNYLRPNIKRGNITLEEEDLILRLHKLLGNRWSLIAGRLPGRTDNEIKNYWNSHLTKKLNQKEEKQATSTPQGLQQAVEMAKVEKESIQGFNDLEIRLDMDEVFDFSSEGTYGLEWINKFLEFDKDPYINNIL